MVDLVRAILYYVCKRANPRGARFNFFYGDRGHFSILGPDPGPALLPYRRRVPTGRAESARAALLGIRILLALAEEVGFQSAAVPAQGRGAGSGTQAPALRPEVHHPGRPRVPAETQAQRAPDDRGGARCRGPGTAVRPAPRVDRPGAPGAQRAACHCRAFGLIPLRTQDRKS